LYEGQVYAALEYAARMIPGALGVGYVWHPDDYHVDTPNGVVYVERDDPTLPTVAYDYRKEKFIWDWRLST
jgi:hypothetical protein